MSTGVNEETPTEGNTSAPVPGTPEYDQAMADKYVESNSPQSNEEPAPAEAAPAEGSPEEKPEEAGLTIKQDQPKEDDAQKEEESVEEAASVLPAELFEKASEEFTQSGELTDETIESFVSKGIPREFIDTYVAGARALQEQMIGEAQSLVGGADNWNAMMAWAKTLPEGDIEAFNEAVVNPKTSTLAIQGLYSRYAATHGNEARSAASGAEHGAASSDVYQSKAEMTADMRDPRYKVDAAFRSNVEQKIARSRQAGTLGAIGTVY